MLESAHRECESLRVLGLPRDPRMGCDEDMATQPWRQRGDEDGALPNIATRIVYSLLKPAVKLAARGGLRMGEVLDLVQLAYFEEMRRHHPRELQAIAEKLDLSLRTVSTLNRRIKEAFFAAETQVQPARHVAALLQDEPLSLAELKRKAPELTERVLSDALRLLRDNEWVVVNKRKYQLTSRLRSYIDDSITRRIDGLNNQMEILASSVARRFFDDDAEAVGRSWAFSARREDIRQFLEDTMRQLRHSAIDLEESGLSSGEPLGRYGITVAFADVEK